MVQALAAAGDTRRHRPPHRGIAGRRQGTGAAAQAATGLRRSQFLRPARDVRFCHRTATDYRSAARQRGEPRQAGRTRRALLRHFPALAICAEGGRNRRRAPRGAGPLDHRPGQHADLALHRQSRLAVSLRHGIGGFAERLRTHGLAADASGTAGLAGGHVPRSGRLVQTAPQADPDERHVPASVGEHPRQRHGTTPTIAISGA